MPPATAEDFFPGHRNLTALLTNTQQQNEQQQYEINQMMMLGRGAVLEDFNNITNTHHHHHVLPQQPPTTTTASASVSTPETTGCIGGDASTGRWPRQETLTLLEIRSRLDPKFKEANQKGPLWDEVSRYNTITNLYFLFFQIIIYVIVNFLLSSSQSIQ
jgi:hypothetical protein